MAELAESLRASFARHSGLIAHRNAEGAITYAELDRASAAIAWFLKQNVPRGQPVMVAGGREHEMISCFLGCLRAGNPYVPTGELIPGLRSEDMARVAGCRHVLQVGGRDKVFADPKVKVFSASELKSIVASGEGIGDWELCTRGDEVAYILFTSGSTGVPKGVRVSAKNLESFLSWTQADFGYECQPMAFLNQAPFHFDLSVYELFNALVSGGSILSLPAGSIKDPERLFADFFAYGPLLEVWVSTPSFLRYSMSHPDFGERFFSKLRQFVLIGEVFPLPLGREVMARFPSARVFNFYGPTEATVAHTVFELTEAGLAGRTEIPLGRPKSGGRVEIVAGEIVLSGENVALGYVNDPVETARKFTHGSVEKSYSTGDLGEIDESGLRHFRGRADKQVKVNGFRVELADIERELSLIPEIEACCEMFVNTDGGSPWIVAFVKMEAGTPGESELVFRKRLKLALSAKLPDYMIPKRFVRLNEMPMNQNGKMDRLALKEML